MATPIYTKEVIKSLLSTDSKWMERGVIVLYERQTQDEQKTGQTHVYNNRGFNSSDSRYMTWVAKWLLESKSNHLNEKHKAKVAKSLPKYWGQILEIIKNNQR
jgi:phage terminase Nu1 subunit (DNA packaging protein)